MLKNAPLSFEIAAVKGLIEAYNDGYEYFDYTANGVTCRAICRSELVNAAKFALEIPTEDDPSAQEIAEKLRWVLQYHGGGYISGTLISGLDPGKT